MLSKLYIKGVTAYSQGNPKEAAQHLASYVAKSESHVDAWKVLGICYFDLAEYPKAIQAFEKTLQLQPKDAEIWFNLGLSYTKNQNLSQAIACYSTCVQHNPQHAKAYVALGDTHRAINQVDEAITHYMSAIHLRGLDAKDLLFKLSQVLLVKGSWQEGFELFEHRIALDTAAREHSALPRWHGQDLQGKRILVECEQGFGDSIQFSRYLQVLHRAGAQVSLACPAPLQSLFQLAFPDVHVLLPGQQIEISSVDYYTPLMSLAWLCHTTPENVPYATSYLQAPQENKKKWAWLGQIQGLKVGLVWSGNPVHKNDKNRSMDFETLIAGLPKNAQYFSLQKSDDLPPTSIHHTLTVLSKNIHDFADTSAICEHMDVVITVDTSIAHLSGALGRPTWVMLPFSPDWRWLLNRDDSVWYEHVKLFRQHSMGDWPSVVTRVAQELSTLSLP